MKIFQRHAMHARIRRWPYLRDASPTALCAADIIKAPAHFSRRDQRSHCWNSGFLFHKVYRARFDGIRWENGGSRCRLVEDRRRAWRLCDENDSRCGAAGPHFAFKTFTAARICTIIPSCCDSFDSASEEERRVSFRGCAAHSSRASEFLGWTKRLDNIHNARDICVMKLIILISSNICDTR